MDLCLKSSKAVLQVIPLRRQFGDLFLPSVLRQFLRDGVDSKRRDQEYGGQYACYRHVRRLPVITFRPACFSGRLCLSCTGPTAHPYLRSLSEAPASPHPCSRSPSPETLLLP